MVSITSEVFSAKEINSEVKSTIQILLLKDEGQLVSTLKQHLKPFPIHLSERTSKPRKMKPGHLLVEGMVTYQPMQQGYLSPFGVFGIPRGFQTRYMEANLNITGQLTDGRMIKEHWILEAVATGERIDKKSLAKDLSQSILKELIELSVIR